jgi:hypothetical protein
MEDKMTKRREIRKTQSKKKGCGCGKGKGGK